MDQKKKTQKTYTLPVFVWGVEKHSQRGLLDYYCWKNKDTKNNVQNHTDDLSLLKKKKKAFCWCYDFVLPHGLIHDLLALF